MPMRPEITVVVPMFDGRFFMIIYASDKMDDILFRRVRANALGYDITLKRKPITEPLELPEENQKSFTAINRFDALFSIYKGLKKLQEFDDISISD